MEVNGRALPSSMLPKKSTVFIACIAWWACVKIPLYSIKKHRNFTFGISWACLLFYIVLIKRASVSEANPSELEVLKQRIEDSVNPQLAALNNRKNIRFKFIISKIWMFNRSNETA
ncbi:uncharacterized protein OCT59_024614 [Rhizophagus irregularis]|uniref:uncharacterized protein n=1 Tax=Rhizophagus irregularis TaxID=588596 RepID=UPI00332A38C6|nr:hypothetical protein OCT59_024614 [Rhizophagus irregularis]